MAQADYSKKALLTKLSTIAPANPADLVSALTELTIVGPTTPDYNIQDLTSTSPYGFASQEEGRTVLAVIKNLQQRVAALEAALVAAGIAEAP